MCGALKYTKHSTKVLSCWDEYIGLGLIYSLDRIFMGIAYAKLLQSCDFFYRRACDFGNTKAALASASACRRWPTYSGFRLWAVGVSTGSLQLQSFQTYIGLVDRLRLD